MMEIEQKLNHLWGKVGVVVNLSQMIEYNLANILAFDEILREFEKVDSMFVFEYNEFAKKANDWYAKLSKNTFGYGLKRAKEIHFFTKESELLLSQTVTKRNYVIHQLFKDDLISKHLETDPDYYYNELEETIELLYTVNNSLVGIFKKQKMEYKLIW